MVERKFSQTSWGVKKFWPWFWITNKKLIKWYHSICYKWCKSKVMKSQNQIFYLLTYFGHLLVNFGLYLQNRSLKVALNIPKPIFLLKAIYLTLKLPMLHCPQIHSLSYTNLNFLCHIFLSCIMSPVIDPLKGFF